MGRPMRDSTEDYKNHRWQALRERLACDGYLLIRGLLSRAACLKAYNMLCAALHLASPDLIKADGSLNPGAKNLGLLSRQDLAHSPAVISLLEACQLLELMAGLLQEDNLVTTEYKWLRAVAAEEFTGVHMDKVYLGHGSQRLLTAWMPLSDVPREQGAMMVSHASHRKRAFARIQQGYGCSSVGCDGTHSGWLGKHAGDLCKFVNPYAVDWRTADFQAGDVVVLTMGVIHMTSPNRTSQVRISCDTRWQPLADVRDPRAGKWKEAAMLST